MELHLPDASNREVRRKLRLETMRRCRELRPGENITFALPNTERERFDFARTATETAFAVFGRARILPSYVDGILVLTLLPSASR